MSHYKFLAALLSIFLQLGFLRLISSTCSTANIETFISQTNTLISNIGNPDSTYSVGDVDAKLDVAFQNATFDACLSLINGMIEENGIRYETIITNECRETNTSSKAYLENPCCNSKMLETSCCITSTITEVQNLARSFKNTVPSCPTVNWPQTRVRVRHHFRVNEKRRLVCQKTRDRRVRSLKHALNNVRGCSKEIFATGIPCQVNEDCYSGICGPDSKSDPLKYTCAPASHALDVGDALTKCVLKYMPPLYMRYFQDILSLDATTSATESQLTNAFVTSLSTNKCVNENVFDESSSKMTTSIVTEHTNEADCTNVKKCSDGETTCADGNSFCGAHCGSNGICQTVISEANSEAQCSNTSLPIGTCLNDVAYHINVGLNDLVAQEACTSRSYCTVSCPGCSEISCQENSGFCFKFPFTGSKCVLPFDKTDEDIPFKMCPVNTMDIGFGCLSDKSSGDCTSAGGRWISAPSSQESCEKSTQNEDVVEKEQLYLTCNEGDNRLSSKEKDKCSTCGFRNDLLFEWVMGSYVQGKWTQKTKWLSRSLQPLYRWAPTLDESAFFGKIDRVEQVMLNNILQSYAQCSILPTLNTFREIACSCEGLNDCFTSPNASIGTVQTFSGIEDSMDLKDATIKFYPNSIPSGVTPPSITVSRVPVFIETHEEEYVPAPIEIPISGKPENGHVVGHGIKLNYASNEGIQVCLQKDSQFFTMYDKPRFAKKSEDGTYYIDDSVNVVTTGELGVICGVVTNRDTYYPAIVPSNNPIEPSAASSIVANLILLATLIMVVVINL